MFCSNNEKIVKIGEYQSYRKYKTGVPLFWTTLYNASLSFMLDADPDYPCNIPAIWCNRNTPKIKTEQGWGHPWAQNHYYDGLTGSRMPRVVQKAVPLI